MSEVKMFEPRTVRGILDRYGIVRGGGSMELKVGSGTGTRVLHWGQGWSHTCE